MRPVMAKALIINAFALTGRFCYFQSVHPRRCLGLCAYWAFSPYNWLLNTLLLQIAFFLYFRLLTLPSWAVSIYIRIAIICTTACAGYGGGAIPSYIYTTSLLLKLLTLPILSSVLYISVKPIVYGRLRAFLSVLFCLLSNLWCGFPFIRCNFAPEPKTYPFQIFKRIIDKGKVKREESPWGKVKSEESPRRKGKREKWKVENKNPFALNKY